MFVFVLLLIGALIARLIELQVYEHATYQTRSENNRIQVQSLSPSRGMIFDRNGLLLADNQNAASLAIFTEAIADLDGTLATLVELLDLDAEELLKFQQRAASLGRPGEPIVLKDSLSEQQVAILAVNRHRLQGVKVQNRLVRNYPLSDLAAHAVGSVRRMTEDDLSNLPKLQYVASDFVGKRGVEATYESALHGRVGYQKVETDAHGRVRRVLDIQQPEAGANLSLHLDARLQEASAEALSGRRGAIVALDPKSGGILAMVSMPSYDPNLFVQGMSESMFQELASSRNTPLFNRAANGQYAPGSTFKPVVGLAGLVQEQTRWDSTIEDKGSFQLPGQERAYRDWAWTQNNAGGQGQVDLRRAIYRSSNVYFYDLASRLEIQSFIDFARQFGFGENYALDLSYASNGLLPNPDWKRDERGLPWYPGDAVNMGIGQGDLLATPLQMATVAATIANRGLLVPPRILMSDQPEDVSWRIKGVASQDWEELVRAMEDVVHRGNKGFGENGTAWAYIGQDIDYRMAGKSGTAQVVEITQGEVYNEEDLSEYHRKHAWFIAFAPVQDPSIAVAVLVENGGGGSSVAAPVARAVIDAHMALRSGTEVAAR